MMSHEIAISKTLNKDKQPFIIFVETLAGNKFQLTVSPKDTVKSIKLKIQMYEGIPVSHQHLLFNFKELDDFSCVTDPSVALYDQAILKLVLSLRGGPISLVHQNKTILRSIQLNCDSLFDKLPPGNRMAVLVFNLGHHLNLLHVSDDEDSKLESSSNTKEELAQTLDSLLEEKCDKVNLRCMEESFETSKKVSLLKKKMEKLAVKKKCLKMNKNLLSCKALEASPAKPSSTTSGLKLPAINQQSQLEEVFRSRSEFSQVPVLPDISGASQSFQRGSRDKYLPCSVKTYSCKELTRPRTSPESEIENQFYKRAQGSDEVNQPYFRMCASAVNSKPQQERKLCSTNSTNDVDWPQNLSNEGIENHIKITQSKDSLHKIYPGLMLNSTQSSKELQTHFPKKKISLEVLSLNEKKLQETEATTAFSNKPLLSITKSTEIGCKASTSNTKPFHSSEIFVEKQNSFDDNHLHVEKIESQHKRRLRCFVCKKKLTLTSTFSCRCGCFFCSNHRYFETHQCTFDFKKDVRKILEEANPKVVASKLPKI